MSYCVQPNSDTNRNCHHVREVVSTPLKDTFSKNNEKTRKTKEWASSLSHLRQKLRREQLQTRKRKHHPKTHHEKNIQITQCTLPVTLLRLEIDFAWARSCYKKTASTKNTKAVLCKEYFLFPFSFLSSEHIPSLLRGHKAAQVHFEVTPMKQ